MSETIMDLFDNQLPENKANEFSPLNLAYIGDAVFETLVRTYVMEKGNRPVNELNRISSSVVNAASQSKMYSKIEDRLSDEEHAILKRGRNAKSNTKAKNASVVDYRRATGVEALFGYLYIKNDITRIKEIFDMCVNKH